MNIRIHAHFPVPKPREVLLLQHAKLRKSHSNKFLVLPKQQKSLFLWSNTLDPPLLPLLWSEWGREEGEWRKCPFRGGWLSQGWNSEGWTDRHDSDSLSPARRRQRRVTPACPSLSLCSFLYLSLLQSHSQAPAEWISSPSDWQNPAPSPHRGGFLATSRPALLAEPLGHSAEEICLWKAHGRAPLFPFPLETWLYSPWKSRK